MSQAENPNNTSRLSRRTALMGLAGAAAAGAMPAIAAPSDDGISAEVEAHNRRARARMAEALDAADPPDPIFAMIDEHRAAVEGYIPRNDVSANLRYSDPGYESAMHETAVAMGRSSDLLFELLHVQPTTLAGVAAILAHLGQPEFLKEELEYPDCRETFLSTFNDSFGECRRAAQDFPVRLAETVRSLIGQG
jgi:hypothetical protein